MDRPRRSARQSTSGHQSPAPASNPSTCTPAASVTYTSNTVPPAAMANGASSSSRYQASSYASPPAFQQHPPPRPQFPHTPSDSSTNLLQAGSVYVAQQQHMSFQHPSFSAAPGMPQQTQAVSQLALQSLPHTYLMGRGSAPIAPGTPSAPSRPFGTAASAPTVPQAMYSTFPARIKAGTTNLLQCMPQSEWYDPSGKPLDPFNAPSHDTGTSTPYRASRASARSRRAAAGVIRYAEAASSDDEFEQDVSRAGTEDEAGSRGLKRGLEDQQQQQQQQQQEDSSRAYLGLPPPASKMVAKRVYHRTNHVYHNDDDLARQAGRNEILVPIKIDLEAEQYRIKDSFTWNMNERLISPHHFAKLLLEDLDMPIEPYATQIMNMINQQIDDAIGVADIEMEPAAGGVWASARFSADEAGLSLSESEQGQYDPDEEAIKEGRSWDWGLERCDETQRAWRKQMAKRLDASQGLGEFEDDLRVIVDYEVQILRHMLRDRLEWDLCSPLTPESFARKLCDDLGLSGEAQALIANSVREQLINHKRAALELGLVGSGRVLKEKEREIEMAWEELNSEKVEKQRKRLERADSALEPLQSSVTSADATRVNSSREASVQPSNAAADDEAVQDGEGEGEGKEEDATLASGDTPGVGEAENRAGGAAAAAAAAAAAEGGGGGEEDDDGEDVETLHLTATATAAPTREGTCTPAIQARPAPSSSTTLVIPATRSSARLSNMLTEAISNASLLSFSEPTVPVGQPSLSASQRLQNATYTVREILSRGPRGLEGIWRDWHESREFGPLLESLNDDDLDKLEETDIRASRRNRREAARALVGSSRRRR
ncbi:related to SFH1 - component of the RSC chromatin remodeling complex [Melanopsichium pennsylvanicum]|uniref:Related to SFH1 - component of the RSC chromatin remodeling complex n=1 Tax=Melanopsichium pennsylvanicum TaxID=63383 RepID=A0AAJ4XTY6_9BASI|nr:related to SFH1 - component of the RSC chromatin remodeling complex [Melanopsichium pennsylvanicum]